MIISNFARLPAQMAFWGVALCAPLAVAQTISLNYRSTDTQQGNPNDFILSSSTVAGVVPVPNWNDAQHSNLNGNLNNPFTVTDLIDSAGNATTADISIAASTGSAGPGLGISPNTNPNANMLLSPKSIGTNAGPSAPGDTIRITGAQIPYANYDVLVYLTDQRTNAENTGVQATLGGDTFYIQTPDDDRSFFNSNGFVRSTDTVDNGAFLNDVGNYLRFEDVTGSGFQLDLLTTQGNTTSDSSRLGVGGIQITQTTPGGGGGGGGGAVPEPTSIALWALMGLACLGFGYRRLRAKK